MFLSSREQRLIEFRFVYNIHVQNIQTEKLACVFQYHNVSYHQRILGRISTLSSFIDRRQIFEKQFVVFRILGNGINNDIQFTK